MVSSPHLVDEASELGAFFFWEFTTMDSPETNQQSDVTSAASEPQQVAEVGTQGQSGASATPQPSEPTVSQGKVDLTQSEDFRKLQSAYDRQIAQERNARKRLEQELQEIRAKLSQKELEDLDSLDPAEKAAKLERRLREMQRQQELERAQAAIVQRAQAMVAKAGLDWNDPRIATVKAEYGPTEEGLAALAERIAEIATEQAKAAQLAMRKAAEEAEKKAREAQQRARVEEATRSGEAMTSMASPAPQLSDEREQQIKNFRARLAALRGKGVTSPEYIRLLSDMRKAGLTVNDLGY